MCWCLYLPKTVQKENPSSILNDTLIQKSNWTDLNIIYKTHTKLNLLILKFMYYSGNLFHFFWNFAYFFISLFSLQEIYLKSFYKRKRSLKLDVAFFVQQRAIELNPMQMLVFLKISYFINNIIAARYKRSSKDISKTIYKKYKQEEVIYFASQLTMFQKN